MKSIFRLKLVASAMLMASSASAYNLTINGNTYSESTPITNIEVVQDKDGVTITTTPAITVTFGSGSGGGTDPNPGVNDAPTITSASSKSVAENSTLVMNLTATDPDSGDTKTFRLKPGSTAGEDNGLFTLTSTGRLSFTSAPDFETPSSAQSSNTYKVEVEVEDAGGLKDDQVITVNVTDVNENPGGGSDCSAVPSVTCIDDIDWTNPGPQETISIVDKPVVAKFVTTSNSSYEGSMSIAAASGTTTYTRRAWISQTLGSTYNDASSTCRSNGTTTVEMWWSQGNASFYKCGLQTNTTYYLHIEDINCPGTCAVKRKIFTNFQP